MGMLASPDGTLHPLRGSHLVGRVTTCDLCVPHIQVSANHAAFRWTGERWDLRDLGSRNGTWVSGRRLEPGASTALASGAAIAFGDPTATWTLVDLAPPSTYALAVPGGETRVAEHNLLALPSNAEPLAQIFASAEGGWTIEADGSARPAEDGATIEVAGRFWRLYLAAAVAGTLEVAQRAPTLSRGLLRFTVSRDEEHVEVELVEGTRTVRLTPRACQFVVLALARARLADRSQPELSEDEHGWVYPDELCRMLRTDESRIRVDLYRFRRQLLDAGVLDGGLLVERRALSGQLRIAVGNLDARRA